MTRVMGLRTKNGRNHARIFSYRSRRACTRRGLGTRTCAPRTRIGVRRTTRSGAAACVRACVTMYFGHTRHAHFPGLWVRRSTLAVITTRFIARTYHKAIEMGAKFSALRETPSGIVTEILKAIKNSREKVDEFTLVTSSKQVAV